MRVLIASDSFKGSLSSRQACDAIAKGISRTNLKQTSRVIPLSDGGEGFSKILATSLNARPIQVKTVSLEGNTISVEAYTSGKIGIHDVATSSGLSLVSNSSILDRSSYGTGIVIKQLIDLGCEEIILGLGGSGTNDLGLGIANCLGYKFYNKAGQTVLPTPKSFLDIHRIVTPKDLPEVKIKIAADVTSPLLGPLGAASQFGKQKGASNDEITFLENASLNLVKLSKSRHENTQGAGAAGGIGFGLLTFFNAHILSGFELLKTHLHLEKHIAEADLIITGEGTLDNTSFNGKLVGRITGMASSMNKPFLIVCGQNKTLDQEYVLCLSDLKISTSEAMTNAKKHLCTLVERHFK